MNPPHFQLICTIRAASAQYPMNLWPPFRHCCVAVLPKITGTKERRFTDNFGTA